MIPSFITANFGMHIESANKIECIKALRYLTGLGLKESKEILERESPQRLAVSVKHNHIDPVTLDTLSLEESFHHWVELLRDNGVVVVVDEFHQNMTDIQTIAISAIRNKNYDLAVDLINILRNYA
jgi:hypothetical protein